MAIAILMLMFICVLLFVSMHSGLEEIPVSRIAFGSCLYQDQPQPIWKRIASTLPDMFVFIGDNIYADTEDMNVMAQKYALLGSHPDFSAFREEIRVLATWDDHDYGINDGGREYPKKEESKRLMLDFFGEPFDSPRRKREGVYTSYLLGPPGKRLQLILLDLRWFRSPIHWDDAAGGYVATHDPDATIMGAQQWEWLEQELKKPAHVRIIASSIQFSSPDHGWEKWANFPAEKAKLIALLDRLRVKNAIMISGDMHFGELSSEKTPAGTTVYDLTSSGMNFFEPGAQYPNRNRIALHDKSPNFGFIIIDWHTLAVRLEVRDDKGEPVITRKIQL